MITERKIPLQIDCPVVLSLKRSRKTWLRSVAKFAESRELSKSILCEDFSRVVMILELVATGIFAVLAYIVVNYIFLLMELRKYPPGPIPLPIIGNIHLLSAKAHESFNEMSKKYGDVFSISIGSQRLVIVNTIESAKEALIQKGIDFAGRPTDIYTMNLVTRNGKDIALADYGEMWKIFRKMAHQSLKMYGTGMENIESLVRLEIQHLQQRLDETNGEPIDPFQNISNAVVNIICAIVFGSRYDVNDPEFGEVMKYNALLVQGLGNADAIAFLPWLRFFPLESLRKIQDALKLRDPLLKKKLEYHRSTFDGKNPRDFTDAILKASFQELRENRKTQQYFTDDHLTMVLNDVFTAGGETTVTTIRWALVYLAHWPEVQRKAKEELRAVVGKSVYPSLSQRSQLPFVDAIIHETLRRSSLVPLGVPHKAVRTSSINGKNIPQNTQILFNLWAIHYDTRHWNDPEKFIPERWLDENGHFVPGNKMSYLPFSAGRRVCLGESLAKAELFLFISFIIQNYDILPSDNDGLPDLEGVPAITFSPKPYKVIFRKAQQA